MQWRCMRRQNSYSAIQFHPRRLMHRQQAARKCTDFPCLLPAAIPAKLNVMKFVAYLQQQGYVRFTGAVDQRVYSYFNCSTPGKAKWYVKQSPASFQCAGCAEECETDDPDGFQLSLLSPAETPSQGQSETATSAELSDTVKSG